jgi:uncharacterized protein with PQ loop repeat
MRGLHHIHLRKRVHKRHLEPYPARHPWKRFLDRIVLAAGIIAPLMTVPQAFKIYMLQDATGVSIVSFGAFALLDIPWIVYGIVHRARAITVAYILWFSMNIIVVAGVLMYGTASF